jgi:predicted cobalt transporter CbtA
VLCCLLAFLVIGPLGLAVTAPAGARGCCSPLRQKLWMTGTVIAFAGGFALVVFAVNQPAESAVLFRHVCNFFPLTRRI